MVAHLAQLLLRSGLAFALLLLLARWMGKKQLGQLTYFDYVTGITIGSIAAVTAVVHSLELTDSLAAMVFWALFTVVMNRIILHSRKWRKVLDGEPSLIMSNGHILEQNMKKAHYSLDDLLEQLRQKNIFAVADVQFAVLESSGELSVQLKPAHQAATKADVHAKATPLHMPIELIMDGDIVHANLAEAGVSERQLLDELARRRIGGVAEVTFACLGTDRKLYVDIRKDDEAGAVTIAD